MAHGDMYMVLNMITWSLILFIILYLFIILMVLPILYKQLRMKMYVYMMFKDLLFLKFLELFKLDVFLFMYLTNLLESNKKVFQKNSFLKKK